MKKLKIINVVGARPNFMKIAPFIKELNLHKDLVDHVLVHTGQHYDEKMSKSFFEDLNIPKPDYNLGIKSESSAKLIAEIMIAFEEVCVKENPDLVVVVGDVNSTIACSMVANRLGKKVVHIEAGLRSFDEKMPEEINRILTDKISNYLFVSEKSGMENLRKENVPQEKVHFVGNIMIDSLISNLDKIDGIKEYENYAVEKGDYMVLTLHRPSNVDSKEELSKILDIIKEINRNTKILWPLHPRTKKNLKLFKLEDELDSMENVITMEPIGYLQFVSLIKNSKAVLTDSGGIQEETTYLGIPCITLRENTERPSTIDEGTNCVTGLDKDKIINCCKQIQEGTFKKGTTPKYWDGNTAKRIVEILLKNEN